MAPSIPSLRIPLAGARRGALVGTLALMTTSGFVRAFQDEPLDEALITQERREADLLRRRGRVRQAIKTLDELIEEEPSDAASRTLRAWCLFEQGEYERALEDARQARADAREGAPPGVAAQTVRTLAEMLLRQGRYGEALALLEDADGVLDPERDARDAWVLGRALRDMGDREGAQRVFELGVASAREVPWERLLAKARCEWAVGRLERASTTLVAADNVAREGEGVEPDILVALGDLYFESEREVEAPGKRPAAALYKEALEVNAVHEGALLGLFELHRYNRRRRSRTPESILEELFAANADSIEGLLAATSAELEVGKLPTTREYLARLEELAPGRREARTLQAALAWVEHRRDDCEAILAELAREVPSDSRPEREVGRHLLELWRFEEGLPFEQRAIERDPADFEAWTQLARALANTGAEDEAREAFAKAKAAAAGRQDAWRTNMTLVLKRMENELVIEPYGELSFAWRPDAADVLREYLIPFYQEARAELAERYGFTPGPTLIEIFRRHQDFSVRSVGFPGFPALGVCFGPVVTAVSPVSELRGEFSWARTGFHEFSHVVHLGLSHNRCPRWITEGLATWEEVHRNPTWSRNMRRELVDAKANGEIIPVRELNRAFRGPRILFGYYQGGLLCSMLIDRYGFPPMIHLLRAFDRGLDVDQAFEEVFATTPEQVDREFAAYVDDLTADLSVEPRWAPSIIARKRLSAGRKPPEDPARREQWGEDWCTIAWANWQAGRKIDAQEALRTIDNAGLRPLRAQLLRAEIALAQGERDHARELYTSAVDAGAREYRALIALASLHAERDELDQAERTYRLAEAAFPGFDDASLSAELELAELYHERGDEASANAARERWLAWNAGEYDLRVEVAADYMEAGRHADAARLFEEANEVDPFRRALHVEWGRALLAEGRFEEAEREFRVARMVPPELDADQPGPLDEADEARILALLAASQKALGKEEAWEETRRRALELDPECEFQ